MPKRDAPDGGAQQKKTKGAASSSSSGPKPFSGKGGKGFGQGDKGGGEKKVKKDSAFQKGKFEGGKGKPVGKFSKGKGGDGQDRSSSFKGKPFKGPGGKGGKPPFKGGPGKDRPFKGGGKGEKPFKKFQGKGKEMANGKGWGDKDKKRPKQEEGEETGGDKPKKSAARRPEMEEMKSQKLYSKLLLAARDEKAAVAGKKKGAPKTFGKKKTGPIVKEIMDIFGEKLPQVAHQKFPSRALQAMLKWGTEEQQEKMIKELEPTFPAICEGRYAHNVAMKMLLYASKERQTKLLEKITAYDKASRDVFFHRYGSLVWEYIMNMELQPKFLRKQMYKVILPRLICIGTPQKLEMNFEELWESLDEESKGKLHEHLGKQVDRCFDKDISGRMGVHVLLKYFCMHATPEELSDTMKKVEENESFVPLLLTKEGVDVLTQILGHASSKQRRQIAKTLKVEDKLVEMACNIVDYRVLLRFLHTVDDTKLLKTSLLKDLAGPPPHENLREVMASWGGKSVLLSLIVKIGSKDWTRVLQVDERAVLETPSPTSLKAPEARQQELGEFLLPILKATFLGLFAPPGSANAKKAKKGKAVKEVEEEDEEEEEEDEEEPEKASKREAPASSSEGAHPTDASAVEGPRLAPVHGMRGKGKDKEQVSVASLATALSNNNSLLVLTHFLRSTWDTEVLQKVLEEVGATDFVEEESRRGVLRILKAWADAAAEGDEAAVACDAPSLLLKTIKAKGPLKRLVGEKGQFLLYWLCHCDQVKNGIRDEVKGVVKKMLPEIKPKDDEIRKGLTLLKEVLGK